MKNVLSTLKKGLLVSCAIITLNSCSNDDSSSNEGKLSLSATSTVPSKSAQASLMGKSQHLDIVITDFRMNVKEFELEIDDDSENDNNEQYDDDGYYDYKDDIELEGPFELDLLAGQISFITADVPNGVYEELEFKFDKSDDVTSDLFEKSVLIQGTLNGTPFIFWHDFEDEVEVDFEDPQFDLTVQNNVDGLVINFDLTLVFNEAAGVDLSQATDGNNNGIIEISPNDTDGNNDLAQAIRNRIKAAIDLLDN
jgi:hypothetical protein